MPDRAQYSARERLRDGRGIEVRALKPDDRPKLAAALERTSSRSLYRRFFGAKRKFTEREAAFFIDVDFVSHVALAAVVEEAGGPAIVGVGRYVVVEPGKAEVAFTVVDAYQGKGIGSLLMRHVGAIARDAGITELTAQVLPENVPMLKVFEKCGLPMTTRREAGAVHVTLRLA